MRRRPFRPRIQTPLRAGNRSRRHEPQHPKILAARWNAARGPARGPTSHSRNCDRRRVPAGSDFVAVRRPGRRRRSTHACCRRVHLVFAYKRTPRAACVPAVPPPRGQRAETETSGSRAVRRMPLRAVRRPRQPHLRDLPYQPASGARQRFPRSEDVQRAVRPRQTSGWAGPTSRWMRDVPQTGPARRRALDSGRTGRARDLLPVPLAASASRGTRPFVLRRVPPSGPLRADTRIFPGLPRKLQPRRTCQQRVGVQRMPHGFANRTGPAATGLVAVSEPASRPCADDELPNVPRQQPRVWRR